MKTKSKKEVKDKIDIKRCKEFLKSLGKGKTWYDYEKECEKC